MRSIPRTLTGLAGLAVTASVIVTQPAVSVAGTTPLVHSIVGSATGGDGGPVSAAWGQPGTVAVDPSGAVAVGDRYRIRRIDPATSDITTVAGLLDPGMPQLNADPLSFGLSGYPGNSLQPQGDGVAYDGTGHLYFEDSGSVFEVQDDGLAHRVATDWDHPASFGVASDGTVFTADSGDGQIFKTDTSGTRTLFAGLAPTSFNSCDNCAATGASITPYAVAPAPDGTVYLLDSSSVRRIDTDGVIHRVFGGTGNAAPADGSSAATVSLNASAIAVASDGRVYIAAQTADGPRIYRLDPDQTVHLIGIGTGQLAATTDTVYVASNGLYSFPADGSGSATTGTAVLTNAQDQSPDGTPATSAWFKSISDVTRDTTGAPVFASGHLVRTLAGDGTIETLATFPSDQLPALLAPASDGSIDVVVNVGATSPPTDTLVEQIPAGGGSPAIIAGGGAADPDSGAAPATTVHLPTVGHVLMLPDGRLLLASRHLYVLGTDGTLSTYSSAVVGALAYDAANSAVDVATSTSAGSGIYRLAGDGTLTLITDDSGSFGMGSDGSVYLTHLVSRAGWITRRYPDAREATIAGTTCCKSTMASPDWYADGVPAVGAWITPTGGIHLDSDDSVTYVDTVGSYPATFARIRTVDAGLQPNLPAQPSGFAASSTTPGVLHLTVPPAGSGESDCVRLRPDGTTPVWDQTAGTVVVYCTGQGAGPGITFDQDGTAQIDVRKLVVAGQTYPLSGHYVATDTPTNSVGEGLAATAAADVAADTTPPGPVTGLQGYTTNGQTFSMTLPTDPDFDHVIARIQVGTDPVADPSQGTPAGLYPPSTGTESGYVGADPYKTYTVTVWAVDIAGNVSTPVSVTIGPGATMPPPQSVSAASATSAVTVSWVPANGFGSAMLRWATGDTVPADTSAGTLLHQGSDVTQFTQSGLAAGIDYSFSVFTLNDQGDASAPVSVTVRATRTTLTGTTTKTYGTAATLSGYLLHSVGGSAAPGRSVTLQSRPHGSTVAWAKAGVATTDSHGHVAFAVKPAVTTDYRLVFGGASTDLGSTSPTVTVAIAPKITLVASHTTASYGVAITLTTTVLPNSHGATVYLQRYYSGAWHTIGKLVLGSTSKAVFSIKPPKGKTSYRTYLPARAGRIAGYSNTVLLSIL